MGRAVDTEFYQAGFDAGWELDLFGGTRRAVEAARADWQAAEAARDAVQASLMAEAALAYVELRTYQERLNLTHQNVAVQEETYALNLSRYQAGLIDELAVQQSLYNLEHTRAAVAPLEAGLEAAKNRLAVLQATNRALWNPSWANPVPFPPCRRAWPWAFSPKRFTTARIFDKPNGTWRRRQPASVRPQQTSTPPFDLWEPSA
ncbi:TolC family protein [Desulfosoma sp.]|uniref:TolC family protein n=1 Tax=Desulfosoma sp. TaxID=2603217 RepID=UPI00404A9BC3